MNDRSPPGSFRSEVADSLGRISLALVSQLDFDSLIRTVVDEATSLCGAQLGALFYKRVSEAGEHYMLYSISGADPEAFARFQMPRSTAIFAPTFAGERVVRFDDVTRSEDYGHNAPYAGMPEGHLPVRAYLAVPVISPGHGVLGGLLFGHEEAGVFKAEHEEAVVSLATLAALSIDNARHFEELRRERDAATRRARVTEEVGRALGGSEDFAEKLRRCAQAVVDGLDGAFARIWDLDEAGDTLVLRASAGLYTHLDGGHSRVPVGAFKIGKIAEERQPHLSNDVPNDPRVSDKAWAQRERMVGFAGYPLLVHGRIYGVLAMFSRSPLPEATLVTLGVVARQVALALESDREERERERFRDLFIGMLGHDLRSPLNAIALGAQTLSLIEDLPPSVRGLVQRMESSSQRMARMVSQLLDFARIRGPGDGMPLSPVDADLHQIFRDVTHELSLSHPARRIEETYRDDGQGRFDPDRLAQVASNLVGNALTHGAPDAPVELSVERDGDVFRIEVLNQGKPIPETALSTLFDPFLTTRSLERSEKSDGLSLGLFITREILRAHGGEIELESTREEGTRARVTLPLETRQG